MFNALYWLETSLQHDFVCKMAKNVEKEEKRNIEIKTNVKVSYVACSIFPFWTLLMDLKRERYRERMGNGYRQYHVFEANI